MQPEVLVAVLSAALMHATWNALVKGSKDPLIGQTLVIGGGALLLAPLALYVPLPSSRDVPYLLATMVVHNAYYACLATGYRHGDLSVVYPIARGSAPLLVAGLTVLSGEFVERQTLVGIGLVSTGILLLGFDGRYLSKAVGYALATGVLIAGYSYLDGRGIQGAPNGWSFIVWLHLISAWPICSYVAVYYRDDLVAEIGSRGRRVLIGGAIAMVAYALVLWAYRRSSLPAIAALRETSVLFATLIGSVLLREHVGVRRVAAASIVVAGVVLIGRG